MIHDKPLPNGPIHWIENGGLHSVPGYVGGAMATGVKDSGDLDLAIIDAGEERTAAAVFTQNKLAAAPVIIGKQRLERHPAVRCVAINSGNANALTGAQGDLDAWSMIERLEQRIGGPALVMSTGIIGVPMPMDKIVSGIDRLCNNLSPEGLDDVATAILTTDTRPKTAAVQIQFPATGDLPEQIATVGGIAKGSGMIHPNMATMLSLIATDAPISPPLAKQLLANAVDASFNCISVDGDTSTNDTALLLAGGAKLPPVEPDSKRARLLAEAIGLVAKSLAVQIVKDGEGMTRLAEIRITGANNFEEAQRIATSVACSSLVKTALAGGDPNWGRILASAANAGVELEGDRLQLTLGGMVVFSRGVPLRVDMERLNEIFSADEVSIHLDLGQGSAQAETVTTDLTKRYVEINSEYTT